MVPDDATVDQIVEIGLAGIEAALPSYEPTERVKTVVGGADSVLQYGSYEASDLGPNLSGRFWMIQLYTYDGRAAWTITCGIVVADASAPEPDLKMCDAVVRTFELSSS